MFGLHRRAAWWWLVGRGRCSTIFILPLLPLRSLATRSLVGTGVTLFAEVFDQRVYLEYLFHIEYCLSALSLLLLSEAEVADYG
jgi:hypothetical protein